MNGTSEIISEVKELKRTIEIIRLEISTLRERIEEIKPFSVFAKEHEEREEEKP